MIQIMRDYEKRDMRENLILRQFDIGFHDWIQYYIMHFKFTGNIKSYGAIYIDGKIFMNRFLIII